MMAGDDSASDELTHTTDSGEAQMVDVGGKPDTARRAVARGEIRLRPSTVEAIRGDEVGKGNVLATARVGAIQAVKHTWETVPMCHQIPITNVETAFELAADRVELTVTVETTGKTGCEMEAIQGVTTGLGVVWDMVKAAEKDDVGGYPETGIEDVRVVCVGAGAAGVASVRLLVEMGVRKDNILVLDSKGVIHSRRDDLNQYKAALANDTDKRTLDDAMNGADIFIGVSGPDMLTPEMVRSMAPRPIIFALANPDPEIQPPRAREVRDDLIIATGRSDFPNQVNNVLGFPYIFRGALDVRSTAINEAMKIAAVDAIAALVRESVPEVVLEAYDGEPLTFGPDYIIPKPNDPRLLGRVSAAVARAAVDSGVARRGYPEHYPLDSVNDIFPEPT